MRTIRYSAFILLLLAAISCKVEDTDDQTSTMLSPKMQTATNLAVNSSFEQFDEKGAPSGWYLPKEPEVAEQPNAPDGKMAASGTSESVFAQAIKVSPNTQYYLGHYSRSDEAGQKTRMQINWLDASGKLTPYIEVATVTGDWKWNEIRAVSPEGAVTAVIYLQPHTQGKIWYDGVWFSTAPSPQG